MMEVSPADFSDGHFDGLVAFTLTPNPKRYHTVTPSLQYKQLIDKLFSSKQIPHTFSKWYFVPELNKQGNVHIHGWFKIKDRIKYYKWFVPTCKRWGFTLTKYNKINNKWTDYVNKEVEDTIDIIGEETPIPWDENAYQAYHAKKRVLADYPRAILKKSVKKISILTLFKKK